MDALRVAKFFNPNGFEKTEVRGQKNNKITPLNSIRSSEYLYIK